jgi:SAM-dependent methyltransferase
VSGRVGALLRCPNDGTPLRREDAAFVSESGRRWPIVRGIPRFVPDDAYVGSFSFEWQTHARTQLDAATGSATSEQTLAIKTGLRAEDVQGRLVLDAGAGAGRFTEVLARWGADVVGVDLSFAVESAYANTAEMQNVWIAQGDIGRLPFAPESFDVIVSIGVLHHTPDTRAYFERLVPLLKPGGTIAIWVYPRERMYVTRSAWIPFTRRIPPELFHRWCRWFVPFAHRHLANPFIQYAAQLFPFSNQRLGEENDVLDTFDGYSPYYHWTHSPGEVEGWFRETGLIDVRSLEWPTAVRGRKPPAS